MEPCVLVFLQIPKSVTGPYDAFVAAVGRDKVAWVGRGIGPEALSEPGRFAGCRVVGGAITLAQAHALKGVSAFAALVPHPVDRVMAQWAAAANDPQHPFHAVAHTFMLRELFEENHPFTRVLSNAATRFLCPPGVATPRADAALAAIAARPFVIGDAAHPRAFSRLMSRVLDLGPDVLPPEAFVPPPADRPRGELMRLIRAANGEDLALLEGLRMRRPARRKVLRVRPGEGAPS